MARSIPYIDTAVSVSKTVAEIEEILQAHGASRIVKEYESGRLKAMGFEHEGVPFMLPAKVEAVYQHIYDRKTRQGTRYRYGQPPQDATHTWHDQAERCAWRNVMFWTKAQLALVEIGMVTITEVFLPYMLLDGVQTLYDQMLTEGLPKMLGSGRA